MTVLYKTVNILVSTEERETVVQYNVLTDSFSANIVSLSPGDMSEVLGLIYEFKDLVRASQDN